MTTRVFGPPLLTLSIQPTFRCTAACANCASLSSPDERTTLTLDVVLGSIREAAELGFYNVVFTGGEATLRWSDLLLGIAEGHRLGLRTRLVTNAHWAGTEEAARRRVGLLLDAGLDEINFSTGDEHARFVPVENVARAVVASAAADLPVHVMVELRAERRVSRQTLVDALVQVGMAPEAASSMSISESPWMPLDPGDIAEYPDGVAAAPATLYRFQGCDSVLQTYTLQADGTIAACCGLGMRLIPELVVSRAGEQGALARAIEEAESDWLKVWIHYDGPDHILAWAQSKDPGITWEGLYAHHCQSCQRLYRDERIRRLVREHADEVVARVLQLAYLERRVFPKAVAARGGC